MAAVALTPEQSDRLIAGGLRDSKPLSPRRRTALAAIIRATASWVVTEASSARIVDRYVAGGFRGAPTLNVLEQRMATRLIRAGAALHEDRRRRPGPLPAARGSRSQPASREPCRRHRALRDGRRDPRESRA
ncbi:MAG TPA: hypothetical protein VFD88_01520 [Clostridia bacterium]|nr:hypothetical protein [Clostridia bacterium]